METENKKRSHNGLRIALAILLCAIGVYFLWFTWFVAELLVQGINQQVVGIAVFYVLMGLGASADCLFFGIYAMLKISKGECPAKIFTRALIIAPIFYFIGCLVNLIGYGSVGANTSIEIFREIMFAIWMAAIITLGIFAMLNLFNRQKLFSLLTASLFIVYIVFLLIGSYGDLFDLSIAVMIGLLSMLAFYIIYVIRIVKEPSEGWQQKEKVQKEVKVEELKKVEPVDKKQEE